MPVIPIICGVVMLAAVSSGCYRSAATVADIGWDEGDGTDVPGEELDQGEDDGGSEGPAELPPCEPPAFANIPFEGCGDGILEPGEECDDGNVLDGDGCTWDCRAGDGSGGIAGSSPLPLPRFCSVQDFKVLVPRVEGTEFTRTAPVFLWTGSDYRLAYLTYDRAMVENYRILGFTAVGEDPRLVFEMPLEVTGGTNGREIASSGGLIELFEVVQHWSPETEVWGCAVSYMAVDFEGNGVIERVALRSCGDLEWVYTLFRVISTEERALATFSFYNSMGLEDGGMIIDKEPPGAEACDLQIRNPMGVDPAVWGSSHNLHFAMNDAGRFLASSDAQFPGVSDDTYFYMGVPVTGDLLSDRIMRPLCAMQYNDDPRFQSDLVPTGATFLGAANCYFRDLEDSSQSRELPYLFRMDAGGDLLAPPTRMLPESFIGLLDAPFMSREHQLQAAVGDDTMGLFATQGGWQSVGGERSVHVFQTLDLEGRSVGEPCVGLEGLPIDESDEKVRIIGLLWDGEGYAVAATSNNDTVYFWRYLPE